MGERKTNKTEKAKKTNRNNYITHLNKHVSVLDAPGMHKGLGDDTTATDNSTSYSQKEGTFEGWSPGLVVTGGDSGSKIREFESRYRILDGYFFTYLFVVKFVMCV